MKCTVEYHPAALRELSKLPADIQSRLANKIARLEENPFPHGCEKLSGKVNLFRIRVGDYRAEYSYEKQTRTVYVHHVGNRREIYRNPLLDLLTPAELADAGLIARVGA